MYCHPSDIKCQHQSIQTSDNLPFLLLFLRTTITLFLDFLEINVVSSLFYLFTVRNVYYIIQGYLICIQQRHCAYYDVVSTSCPAVLIPVADGNSRMT